MNDIIDSVKIEANESVSMINILLVFFLPYKTFKLLEGKSCFFMRCWFEGRIAEQNKCIQTQYWKLFSQSNWDTYSITTPGKGVNAIPDYI